MGYRLGDVMATVAQEGVDEENNNGPNSGDEQMIDRNFQVSVSVVCAAAWTAWAVMVALFAVALATDCITLALVGLASAAIAATLHVRCFLNHLDRHLADAYELGRESERVPRLHRSL